MPTRTNNNILAVWHNPDLPSGYDVRDLITLSHDGAQHETMISRIVALDQFLSGFVQAPEEWLVVEDKKEQTYLSPMKCESWRKLVSAWRKTMRWTPGLDRGLIMMLASAMSTNLVGEQIWVKIIGPPSCGKTTLLEGLAVNRKYTISKDTIRGFYSGLASNSDGEDASLASKARGRTLLTKEGDSLLKSPNLYQILSEARGIYDRVGRTHYRNRTEHEYMGHRMTWVLCGTNALREIDDSELGSRFIDCIIMDEIDDEFEDEVAMRAARQESMGMRREATEQAESQYSPELARAMKLTGGYVGYLREHAAKLIGQIEEDDEALRMCARLGKFIALMRARPRRSDDERDSREFSARLSKQMTRCMKSIAVVLNQVGMSHRKTRSTTIHVALDTCRGKTFDILKVLWANSDGMDHASIAVLLNSDASMIRHHLRFLRGLGIVQLNRRRGRSGARTRQYRYQLTRKMKRLYQAVRIYQRGYCG